MPWAQRPGQEGNQGREWGAERRAAEQQGPLAVKRELQEPVFP